MTIFIDNRDYNLQDYKNKLWWELIDVSEDIKNMVYRHSGKYQRVVYRIR